MAGEFKTFLSDLQVRYPAHNYISKQQVKDICLKYKLVAGPLFLFNQQIPARNVQEMKNFKLHDQDRKKSFSLILDGAPETGDTITMRSQYVQESQFANGEFIFHFNRQIQIVVSQGYYTLYAYDSMDMGTPITMERRKVEFLHIQADRKGIYCEVKLLRSFLKDGMYVDYAERAVPLIVAPAKDFVQHPLSGVYLGPTPGGNFVVPHNPAPEHMMSYIEGGKKKRDFLKGAERYKIEKERRDKKVAAEAAAKIEAQRKFRENFIEDPILLQPLPVGGFLVVSKWGAEANISEIQNQIMN